MYWDTMPTIRIKPATFQALNVIKGLFMTQEGRRLSYDEVIGILIVAARFTKDTFPDWPIIGELSRMSKWEREKYLKEIHAKAFAGLKKQQ